MIVTPQNLEAIVKLLSEPQTLSVDTETTGLRPYQGSRLFSIIIADASLEYYFNFQAYPSEGVVPLPKEDTLTLLQPVLRNPGSRFLFSNAKFDLAMLALEGLEVGGEIYDTEALGRVEKNNRFKFSLDALAKELGHAKDTRVEEYIETHKLYEYSVDDDGKKERQACYWKVPFSLIVPYACKDARLTYLVAEHQLQRFAEIDAEAAKLRMKPITPLVENEIALTPVLFRMERHGVKIDREYVTQALAREQRRVVELKEEFAKLTGKEFIDSAKTLAPIFDELGLRYPFTETGRASFTADFLEDLKHPLAKIIQGHRDAIKRGNTYYKNFLYYADSNDRVHLSLRQGGTLTGRMSAAQPNLQNLTKRKDKGIDFPVRRSFIPTEGFFLGFLDLDQAEYRLMLERAKEMPLIEMVLGGLDVHQATSDLVGIEREYAKTLNFMLLYGGGIAKLALALFNATLPLETLKAIGRIHIYKMTHYPERAHHLELLKKISAQELATNLEELYKARALLDKYFVKLPKVKDYSRKIQSKAKERGYIVNWFGRRCYYTRGFSTHMAGNHDIQGGIADVSKIALVKMAPLFEGKKSRIVLQVHDEIEFEFHESEKYLFSECKKIMEEAYPYKFLPITCGADYSYKSWADKEPWLE